ncbi:hypothetical protein PGT21_006686 [Puccinia graminis f. sp. tritici]|uniref:Uncharacterized protein n=1 Tax=Puccinia graminis f. sp. tritici TaxID=56615 RepID=A0A5B0PA15_PUCGR|nr:hypothetical protein PGT21_006686 [Puccinia graminis f. sp. tritici]
MFGPMNLRTRFERDPAHPDVQVRISINGPESETRDACQELVCVKSCTAIGYDPIRYQPAFSDIHPPEGGVEFFNFDNIVPPDSNKVKIHKYILLDPSFDLNEDKMMIIGKIDLLHIALYTLGVSQLILSTPIEGFGTIIACFPLEHFHSLLLLDSFFRDFELPHFLLKGDTSEIQRGRSGYQNSRIGEAGYSGAGRSRNGRSKGKEPERIEKNYKSQIETHQQLQNKYPDYDQHEAAKITSRLHQLLVDNSKNEVSTDKMGDEIDQISSEFGSWLVKIKANQITHPHPEFVQDFNNVYLKLIPQARQKLIERLRQENKIYP